MIVHLGYHSILEDDEPTLGSSVSIKTFGRQMQFLKDSKLPVGTMEEVVECLEASADLPDQGVTLSFDDGLKSQLRALPILKKFGFPATFFIISQTLLGELPDVIKVQILLEKFSVDRIEEEFLPKIVAGSPYETWLRTDVVDRKAAGKYECVPQQKKIRWIKIILNKWLPPSFRKTRLERLFKELFTTEELGAFVRDRFLTEQDLRIIANSKGMHIGFHTHTHSLLSQCGEKEIRDEFEKPLQILDKLYRSRTKMLAWPFHGTKDPLVRDLAREYYQAGFDFATGAHHQMPAPPYDSICIPRVDQQSFLINFPGFATY